MSRRQSPYNHTDHKRPNGYSMKFSNHHYDPWFPKELDSELEGWAMRRQLKEWCLKMGYSDFIILRCVDYQMDLVGTLAIYELWIKDIKEEIGINLEDYADY